MRKKVKPLNRKFHLDGAGIETISEEMNQILTDLRIERMNRLRIRLSLEENLLRYRDHFGESQEVEFSFTDRFRRPVFQISLEGEIFNSLSKEEHEMDDWSRPLLSSVGLAPQFIYSSNTNILRVTLPREGWNPVLKLFIGILIGLCTAFLLQLCVPDDVTFKLADLAGGPAETILFYILNLISGPVIFFMVLSTVTSMGSVSGRGARHARIVGRYFLLSFIVAVAVTAVCMLVFEIPLADSPSRYSTYTEFLNILYDFIPKDIVDAFIESQTPQLILMAFVIGIAMNALHERVSAVTKLVQEINIIGLRITEWVSSLIPFFLFALVVILLLTQQSVKLYHLWIPLSVAVGCAFICMAVSILYTSLRKRVRVRSLVRKLWPPFFEALKTGSVNNSYGLAEASCRQGLGIEKEFTRISLSHGLILYMPAGILAVIVFSLYSADWAKMSVYPLWLIILIILAVILTVAAPPVPGVSLMVYISVFSQMDLPDDLLMPAIIFDVIFGILAGAVNQLMLQIEMIHHADRVGLLNRVKLKE